MEDKIIEIVVGKDEVTWQSMVMNLVKAEGMDPWNVNISLLTQKYIDMLKKLKELDFRVSGKMVLAAAILLRLKTSRLVGADLMELERLMTTKENELTSEAEFYEELEQTPAGPEQIPELMPRTPQPRKRKVSIYDLMGALEKALEVRDRRILRRPVINIKMPERKVDITKLIGSVYDRIKTLLAGKGSAKYSEIINPENKEERLYTFVSLLYLANHDQRKIDLIQQEPFGEIEIVLKETPAIKAEPIPTST